MRCSTTARRALAALSCMCLLASHAAAAPPPVDDTFDTQLRKPGAKGTPSPAAGSGEKAPTPAAKPEKPAAPPPANGANKPAVSRAKPPSSSGTRSSSNTSTNPDPRAEIDVSWEKLWDVPVGTASPQGQVAARGPLVAVASRGTTGENDEWDGVHIIDGRSEPAGVQRRVRLLPSPLPKSESPGDADAIGVALDGDFVVFGTLGGAISKVRLDGWVKWTAELPAGTRPTMPSLLDLNNDGTLDVVTPLMPRKVCSAEPQQCEGWQSAAAAHDGRTGALLWLLPYAEVTERYSAALESKLRERLNEAIAGSRPCRERGLAHIPIVPAPSVIFDLACAGEGAWEDTLHLGADVVKRAQTTGSVASTWLDRRLVLEARGLARGNASHVLSFDPRALRLSLPGAEPSTGTTVLEFNAITAPPTIADVNGDGVWDVLVPADGRLHAFSTHGGGPAPRTLPRGDLAATGALPWIDTPEAYRSRALPRDSQRWLRPDQAPDAEVWKADPSPSQPTVLEAPESPQATGRELVVQPRVTCGREYGLNEGRVVVQDGSAWRLLPTAPSPAIGIGCEYGDLLVKTAELAVYRLPPPKPWIWWAYGAVALTASAVLCLRAYSTRRLRAQQTEPHQDMARPAILSDAPRTRLSEADPAQAQLVQGLLNVIDNHDTKPPVTIALYGAWGSGKSSVMHMLRRELQQTNRYIDVWFNAWRYNREEQLAPALLQTIVDEVRRQADYASRVSMYWDRIRKASVRDILLVVLGTLFGVFVLMVCWRIATAHSAGLFSKGGALSGTLVVLSGAWSKIVKPLLTVFSVEPAKLLASQDSTRRIQFVREFAREFEQVSHHLQADTRLIVYIDDLDRCRPERILDVLETISMLADTGCGYFVLAIDPATVARAIELSYKDMLELARRDDPAEAANYGRRYLEKMITLGLRVPAVPPARTDTDRRLDEPAERSRARWWVEQVRPTTEWTIACALMLPMFAFVLISTRAAGGVISLADIGAELFAKALTEQNEPESDEEDDAKSSGDEARRDNTSAPQAEAKIQPANAASSPRTAAAAPPGAGQILAPLALPAVAPLLVQERTTASPADVARFNTLMRWLSWGFMALIGSGMLGILAREGTRRRRMRHARPVGKDDAFFVSALPDGKSALPPNPRNVVRFINLARFLYRVVADDRDAPPRAAWQRDFFPMLSARWLNRPEPVANPWLHAQLDLWLEPSRGYKPESTPSQLPKLPAANQNDDSEARSASAGAPSTE